MLRLHVNWSHTKCVSPLFPGFASVISVYCQPIIDNPAALLHGEHTRSIVKKTPTARAGGIMMFAVKKLKVNAGLSAQCACVIPGTFFFCSNICSSN